MIDEPRQPTPGEAVRARVEICLLAIARGVDASLVDQVIAELGEELRLARLARLPRTAAPVAVALRAAVRRRRRRA